MGGRLPGMAWPSNVTVINGGPGWLVDRTKAITPRDLMRDHFPHSAGTLIIMKNDPIEYTANGFTNLIEAMALAQPVIMTKTGALPGEIDVERLGCGIFVPPEDPQALAEAIVFLADNSHTAEAMGQKGREMTERYYNVERYASDLHDFFETL